LWLRWPHRANGGGRRAALFVRRGGSGSGKTAGTGGATARRGELQIELVQALDLGRQVLPGIGVVDGVVGAGQPQPARRLRLDHLPGQRLGDAVALHQALQLGLHRGINHQDAVDQAVHAGFQQDRHRQDAVGRGLCAAPVQDALADQGMGDGLELAQRGAIGKDPFAQPAAVERAVSQQVLAAEARGDGGQGRRRGRHHLARHVVAVQQRHAAGDEQVAGGALAAGDAAGEADDQGAGGLLAHRCARPRRAGPRIRVSQPAPAR
jgi:hypothetical protein